jgi:hypothetical protein
MATGPSSCAVSAAADVWTSRSGEPSNSRRFPTSEIGGSRSDRRRSPKTEIPRLVSTSAYGRSETKPSSMRSLATTSRATAWMHACPGIEPQNGQDEAVNPTVADPKGNYRRSRVQFLAPPLVHVPGGCNTGSLVQRDASRRRMGALARWARTRNDSTLPLGRSPAWRASSNSGLTAVQRQICVPRNS